MTDWVYTLSGRAIDLDGRPLEDIPLLVIGRPDAERCPLVARGHTGPGGTIALSFTRQGLTQGTDPPRVRPRLTLLFLPPGEHEGPVMHSQRVDVSESDPFHFAAADVQLRWREGAPVDAPLLRDWPPPFVQGQRRLLLDHALAGHALDEVAPLVARATGDARLLEGVHLELVEQLDGDGPVGVKMGGEGLLGRLVGRGLLSAFHHDASAMFRPRTRAIVVHRPVVEQNGLDNLKIVLGHELVHASQWRTHPELDKAHAGDGERALRVSANVEGHAYFIERHVLSRRYPLGGDMALAPSRTTSPLDRVMSRLARDQVTASQTGQSRRWELIARAIDIYRERTGTATTAPFDPTVTDALSTSG